MLEDMRVGYRDGPSDGVKVPDDPLEVLSTWIAEAEEAGSSEPNAMHLATHDEDGPDGRMVLLKHLDSELGFFTNTGSSKALQLASHPSCALTFWWPELERQVRIRGEVRPMPEEQVERYHAARPRGIPTLSLDVKAKSAARGEEGPARSASRGRATIRGRADPSSDRMGGLSRPTEDGGIVVGTAGTLA